MMLMILFQGAFKIGFSIPCTNSSTNKNFHNKKIIVLPDINRAHIAHCACLKTVYKYVPSNNNMPCYKLYGKQEKLFLIK